MEKTTDVGAGFQAAGRGGVRDGSLSSGVGEGVWLLGGFGARAGKNDSIAPPNTHLT